MFAPPALKAFPCSHRSYAGHIAGLSERHHTSIVSNNPVISFISCLLFSRSPAAVGGLIISEIVNALDRVFGGRAKPHVRIKILELHPPLANLDTTPAVPFKVFSILVNTSLPDCLPRPMLRSIG